MNDDSQQTGHESVRVTQIITSALLMGLVAYSGVALMQRPEPRWDMASIAIPGFGVLAGVVGLMMSGVVPNIVASGARRKVRDTAEGDELCDGDFGIVVQTAHIIRVAVCEGVAFLNLAVYLMSGHGAQLVMTGASLLMIAANFPTSERFNSWCRQQRELVQVEMNDTRRDA